MGKGANKQLMNNAGVAQSNTGRLNTQAQKTFDYLNPQLEAQASNPQGFGADLPAINTASQQSLGGSVAGVTGQADLEAARTRNAGGFSGAIGEATRSAQRQLSENAVNVQAQNALLKQQQREQALSALQRLYGMDLQTALSYLNSSSESLTEENKSHPNQQGLLTAGTFISDLGGGAKGGADTYRAIHGS